MKIHPLQKIIDKENKEIMGMIKKTPVASKIEVQEYHNTIIKD